jgi:hypothetical protein
LKILLSISNCNFVLALDVSRLDRIEVKEPVTKEKLTTPKIIIREQNIYSKVVVGRISP